MIFRGIKSIFSDDYYYELVSKNIIGFIEKIQKYNRVLLTSLIKIIGETSKTSFSFNSEPLKEITGTKTTQLRWSANHAISNQIDEEPAFDFGGYMKFYANKKAISNYLKSEQSALATNSYILIYVDDILCIS